MKKVLVLTLFLFLLSPWSAYPLTKDQKEEDFSELKKLLDTHYVLKDYKKEVLGIKYDDIWKREKNRVLNSKNKAEFMTALQRTVGRLRDWHLALHRPVQGTHWLGFWVRRIEKKAIVVFTTKSLEKKGISVGSELLTIDGAPVDEVAKSLLIYRRGSTKESEITEAFKFLSYRQGRWHPMPGSIAALKFKRSNAEKFEIKLSWKAYQDSLSYPTAGDLLTPPKGARVVSKTPDLSYIVEYREKLIGYLAIRAFIKWPSSWPPTEKEISEFATPYLKAISQLKKVSSLVIDLRDNEGGGSYYYDPILESLKKSLKGKKLFVIINSQCHSACEIVTSILKEKHEAIILGENSAGAGGATKIVGTLPNTKLRVMAPYKLTTLANGKPYENIGIKPDKKFSFEVNDVKERYQSHNTRLFKLVLQQQSRATQNSN